MSTGAILLICLFAFAGGLFVGDMRGWHKGFDAGCKQCEMYDDTLKFYHDIPQHDDNEGNGDKS